MYISTGRTRILFMDLEIQMSNIKLVKSCLKSISPGLVAKCRELTFKDMPQSSICRTLGKMDPQVGLGNIVMICIYAPIAFDERVTFWFQRTWSLPCACVFAALYVCAIA